MQRKYETPVVIEVIKLEVEDIIVTSSSDESFDDMGDIIY